MNEMSALPFFENFDVYRYTQENVADTLMANTVDLNAWRKRGFVFGGGWERSDVVRYTGRGVVMAGTINDLAWALGPSKAAEVALTLAPHVAAVLDPNLGHARGPTAGEKVRAFAEQAIILQQPIGSYERGKPKIFEVKEDIERELAQVWPYYFAKLNEIDVRAMNSANLVWPFGRRVFQWALGAELRHDA